MSRSERVYRLLLLAYPGEFRREYGEQMEQAFGDLYRVKRGEKGGITRLWMRTIVDVVRTVVAQRIIPRTNQREIVMQSRRLAVIGFVLLLAPLYFVSASLLKYGLGVGFFFDPLEAVLSVAGRREVFNLVSPVVFLGGLCSRVGAQYLCGYAVRRQQGRRHHRQHGQGHAWIVEHRGRRCQRLAVGDTPRLRLPRKLHPPLKSDHIQAKTIAEKRGP